MSSLCQAEYRVNEAGDTVRRTPTEVQTLNTHRIAWSAGWSLEDWETFLPEEQTILLTDTPEARVLAAHLYHKLYAEEL